MFIWNTKSIQLHQYKDILIKFIFRYLDQWEPYLSELKVQDDVLLGQLETLFSGED